MPPQPYPFSKNRYFPYKRMRSADFTREQEYADRKLAFLSHWCLGEGAAVGLEAQRIDSDSLLVSPGFAVDGQGRFLIVDEPAVCRVRALPGFDGLAGETALLWLAYREEPADPMFVPGDGEEVQEYAAAWERFSFHLTGLEALPPSPADRLLLRDRLLFEDGDVRVRQVLPRALPARGRVQLRLVVESFCPEPLELEIRYAPVFPAFVTDGEGQPPRLERRLTVEKGAAVLPLPLVLDTTAQAMSVSTDEGSLTLEKRGVELRGQGRFQEEFSLTPGDPLRALEEGLLARDLQQFWSGGGERGVPIAAVRFLRCGAGIMLDDVIPLRWGQRAAAPWLTERLRLCGAFFPADGPVRPSPPVQPAPAAPPPEPGMQMATGVVTLNSGLHPSEGKVLRSGEIDHGLGPGPVFIQFGVENVYPAVNLPRNRTDLLLGDISLFEQAGGTYERDVDKGVCVHPDKGTFELAVRLKGGIRQPVLRLRWFAWKPEEDTPCAIPPGSLLRLEPDMIHVAPGAVVNFVPVFSGGAGAPCEFLAADRRSGLVTRDGIYTAPEKDGLYQVYGQVRDRPETRVSSFVIVRGGEGAEHGPGTV